MKSQIHNAKRTMMKSIKYGAPVFAVLILAVLSGCGCFYRVVICEMAPPGPPPPTRLETSGSVTLNIEFEPGESYIKHIYTGELKYEVADFLKAHPETTVVIQGHTDSVESTSNNIALSQARATSVKNFLVNTFGIADDRLRTMGYGSNKPIASNTTEQGRQKNRRVEVAIERTAK